MIEYVTPGNIDDRILTKAARLLDNGGLVALPTDTSWALACSLQSKTGIKKLKSLSGERDERRFTLLCTDISQFGELCSMDNTRFRLIKRLSPGPYTFILKTLPGTEKILDIRRREVGIRIPDHPIPLTLIKSMESPLYSITAKQNMTGGDTEKKYGKHPEETPAGGGPEIPEEDLFEADWELEAIDGLDLIISGDEEQTRTFSTVLDITGDEVQVLRQGAGRWPA
ncbi:MAG: L-threonylcarbamoyladenylate synthase [Treponema sp.]|jgi:tRNA threonylcarbamoyl adenosine modification protein (Sua5/YciO/YrdC/YwlC family)|nr:L-threonylcarbamoyladenylate synthase [Treponema sp.]